MDTPDIRNTKEDAETIWGELSGTEDEAWSELLLDKAELRSFIVEVLGYDLSGCAAHNKPQHPRRKGKNEEH